MLLRYAILGLLDGQELHGYRIKAVFEERIGPLWPLNFGQIYQTLKDLRRRGLVEGRFDRGSGHVGRWVYTITAKGRRALETWIARSPRRPQTERDEMMVRLLVLERRPVEARLAQLAAQERVYREWVASLAIQRRDCDPDTDRGRWLRALATDAAIFHAQAHLAWLAHCADRLEHPRAAEHDTDAEPRCAAAAPPVGDASTRLRRTAHG